MKRIALQIRIKGRVQGVGYRRFAERKATEYNICGWARNLTNGDVEVCAMGLGEQMQKYLASLKEGPLMGRVDELITQEIKAQEMDHFQILPDGDAK
jgi:acylphosphatase